MAEAKVGDIWHRFEDRRYSVADEYGEHSYTTYDVAHLQYWVVKLTPCGVQLVQRWGQSDTCSTWDRKDHWFLAPRFQNFNWNKKFACPTLAEAFISYEARKNREIGIYQARILAAQTYIQIARRKVADELRKRGAYSGPTIDRKAGVSAATNNAGA